MPSEARLKKNNRTIKRGPKKLNFGASKPGVGGARAPRAPPGSASEFRFETLEKHGSVASIYRRCH